MIRQRSSTTSSYYSQKYPRTSATAVSTVRTTAKANPRTRSEANHQPGEIEQISVSKFIAQVGERMVEALNDHDERQFGGLCRQLEKNNAHQMILDKRGGWPNVKTKTLNDVAMRRLTDFFMNPFYCSFIHDLSFKNMHLSTLKSLLDALETQHHLVNLSFSGTQVGSANCVQAHHFRKLASIVAKSSTLASLNLDHQPLVSGQDNGPDTVTPAPLLEQQYLPDASSSHKRVATPSSLPDVVRGVGAACAKRDFSLSLRYCNLRDHNVDELLPLLDPLLPFASTAEQQESLGAIARRQVSVLDLRGNDELSASACMRLLNAALLPSGALTRLYLPAPAKHAYLALSKQERKQLHARLEKTRLTVLEPWSSALEPEFNDLREILAAHQDRLDIVASGAIEPSHRSPSPFDLGLIQA